MKYTNLVDAVTGIIYEGKSYKRNQDDDAKNKKEKDQERKDSAKNKKQQVSEAPVAWAHLLPYAKKFGLGISKSLQGTAAAYDLATDTHLFSSRNIYWKEMTPRKFLQSAADEARKNGLTELADRIMVVLQPQQVGEGKTYKKNKDEDSDDKKKADKQKRDAKKPVAEAVDPVQRRKTLRNLIKKTKDLEIEHSDNPSKQAFYEKLTARYQEELDSLKGKKVAEDMRPSEVKPASGSPLKAGGRTLGHSLQPGIMFRVATGPLSKKDLYCARVKDIEGIKWVYIIDAHGDQDWHKADDIAPMKITMRKADDSSKARFTSMTEGKTYKKNKDEDAADKKKEDKQKRDAKKPVVK